MNQHPTHSILLQPYATQLLRVFVYYCSFGDKDNHCLLKIQNYKKLLADLQLLTTPPPHPSLDLIFTTHATKHALNHQQYIQALTQVTLLALKDLPSEEQRVKKMLQVHHRALYEYIMRETEYGRSLEVVGYGLLREESYMLVREFKEGMASIYCHYFKREHLNSLEEELKDYFKMGRELGVIPKVMSKPVAYLLFLQLHSRTSSSPFRRLFPSSFLQHSHQHHFDMMCLVEWVIWSSHLNNRHPTTPSSHKIYQLLELVQLSTGYKNISKISKTQHFFLTQAQLNNLANNTHSQHRSSTSPNSPRRLQKAVQSPTKHQLGQYHDTLRNKFIQLCSKKSVESNFYLEPNKAKSMLKGMCPSMSGSLLEGMVVGAGRLNFDNFVGLLNRVAVKMGIEPERLYAEVGEYSLNQPNQSAALERLVLTESEQVTCGQMLSQIRPYLRTMYDFFQFNGGISCSGYLNLLQETNLLPGLLNTLQATDIYHFCTRTPQKMTQQQLQASLMRIVVSMPFPCDLQGMERLVHLLQVMSGSRRGQSLMKKNFLMMREHPLYKLRIGYPHIYRAVEEKLPPITE